MVVSAWPGSPACPVTLLRRLKQRAGLHGDRALFSKVSGEAYATTDPISYWRLRKLMLDKFEAIGLDRQRFGTHSCRAGGATLAANLGVPDRLWREHGGWSSVRASLGYIKTAHDAKLRVTRTMVEGAAKGKKRKAGGAATTAKRARH